MSVNMRKGTLCGKIIIWFEDCKPPSRFAFAVRHCYTSPDSHSTEANMKLSGTVSLAILFPLLAFGQQGGTSSMPDTVSASGVTIVDLGFSSGKPTVVLPPSLEERPLPFSPSLLFVQSAEDPPPYLLGNFEPKIDLLASLRLQRQKEEELRTLRTILGSVQIGGVAYLAYRRLKKYGLK